jgi:hypothetical protein
MARYEPLGHHALGVIQFLRVRGAEQLFTQRGLDLWRVVHHRLQARQLLLGEQPIPESQQWLEMLAPAQPDLHIARDAHLVNQVVADAKTMLTESESNFVQLDGMMQSLEMLDLE